ncbi:hypothetical protein B7494_g5728 [Chlorociboria aeruginascens]|nr:hypothetical protein B7494_g5728 [Chlorociboria aeruginascens]
MIHSRKNRDIKYFIVYGEETLRTFIIAYMITRPSYGVHICLRCRLRQIKQPIPWRSHRVFLSTESRPKEEVLEGDNLEEEHKSIGIRPTLARRVISGPVPPRNELDSLEGRLYGHAGHKAKQEREALQVDNLGKPAEVLVLRNSLINFYGYSNLIDPADDPEPIDIIAKLDEQRGLVDKKEVEQNINNLRPKEGEEPQTWEEYNQLIQKLQLGFSAPQLASYIQNSSTVKLEEAPKDDGKSIIRMSPEGDEKSILRISPWMPAISPSEDQFDESPLRGYSAKSHGPKQRLSLRLMRECWSLELPEISGGIGEVEIQIRPGDWACLVDGPKSLLRSISEKYITSNVESVQPFPSRGVIRITTTRAKSRFLVDELEEVLQKFKRIVVSLAPLTPTSKGSKWNKMQKWIVLNFDDSVVSAVARLTKTNILRVSKRKLLITYMDSNPGSSISRPEDIARRLLLTSGSFSNRETYTVEYKMPTRNTVGGFVSHELAESLPWRDKLRQWTRWALAVEKDSEVEKKSIKALESSPELSGVDAATEAATDSNEQESGPHKISNTPDVVLDALKAQKTEDLAASQCNKSRWSSKYFTETSAIVGKILHSYVDMDPADVTELKFESTDRVLHAFSSDTQNLSRLLADAKLRESSPRELLVMRFQPNPWFVGSNGHRVGSEALSAFPQVEMRFRVMYNKELLLQNVDALVSSHNSDLMLPESAVDLRFQQRVTSRLKFSRYRNLPQIEEFIEMSNLDLMSSKPIETPPKITLPIAKFLCKPPGVDLLGQAKTESNNVDVEYLFAGLEYRKTIAMSFKGWLLLYTSIEAGKAGGRRGELKLRPVRHSKMKWANKPRTLSAEKEYFMQTAYELADAFGSSKVARKVGVEKDSFRLIAKSSRKSPKIFNFSARRFMREDDIEEDQEVWNEEDEQGEDTGTNESREDSEGPELNNGEVGKTQQ